MKSTIPICPLLSAGSDMTMVCVQERCAWYISSLKNCGAYVIMHKALLDVKEKQNKGKQND